MLKGVRMKITTPIIILILLFFQYGCTVVKSMSSKVIGCPESEIKISNRGTRFDHEVWNASCRGKTFLCKRYSLQSKAECDEVTGKLPSVKKEGRIGKAVLIPIGTLGEIKASQIRIISNRFMDELSNNYDLIPQEAYEKAEEVAFQELDFEECTEEQCIRYIQEILQIENMFHLQIIRDDKDTQISLTFIDLDRKIVKSSFCEDCNTSSLVKSVSKLYKELLEKM